MRRSGASRKLRAAVIGLGVGEAHAAGYGAHPDCEVAALCDLSGAKLAEAGRRHPGARLTRKAAEILDDPAIDVVSIASFDNFHADQIVRALRNGKHVFVEKPLCLRESEAVRVRKALRARRGLKLSSNLVLRRSPRFRWLKEAVREGKLGELYYLEGDYNYGRIEKITQGWRGRIGFYSVVHGGGIHLVDLLLWLSGKRVKEVAAYGNRIATRGTRFRYNDCVAAILKFDGGIVGKVTSNFGCVHPHYHAVSVYGTKATFVNGRGDAELFTSRDSVPPQKVTALYPGVPKSALLGNFVDHILRGARPEVSAEDVFAAMSVSFAIEKAAAKSGSVKVRYL